MGSLFPALREAHSRQLASQRVETVPTKRRRGTGIEERQKRRENHLLRGRIPRIFREVFKV